ncbi:hypothetical protein ACFYXF_14205 [Streptomyces sp. NPDC002680]|uniref:hypothetical protein n=1 Tax=Streptomyces sp. NPDC002680 TaxID=3364659 RepID=UPI0036A8F381
MPAVLTEASTFQCDHHGTAKAQASRSGLTVDGKPVLVDQDLPLTPIVGCIATPKCAQVEEVTAGVSRTLTVDGRPVLLATAHGKTNAGLWQVADPVQTKLEAA